MNTNVFIFGSNLQGFHGAGTAGYAMRGESANTWRTCPIMQAAIKHGPGFKGKLAVFGEAEGLMQGTQGWSYAIPTVTKPGAKRSIPLATINGAVFTLLECMREHPDYTFCLTPFGCGYAGYSFEEMRPQYERILAMPNGRWATTVPQSVIDQIHPVTNDLT